MVALLPIEKASACTEPQAKYLPGKQHLIKQTSQPLSVKIHSITVEVSQNLLSMIPHVYVAGISSGALELGGSKLVATVLMYESKMRKQLAGIPFVGPYRTF